MSYKRKNGHQIIYAWHYDGPEQLTLSFKKDELRSQPDYELEQWRGKWTVTFTPPGAIVLVAAGLASQDEALDRMADHGKKREQELLLSGQTLPKKPRRKRS
jgi:hypothetical protein